MIYNSRLIYPFRIYLYRVQRGDTLYRIAQKFNTTVQNILKFNYIPNPNILSIGMILRIPLSPQNSIIYTVRKGDTLALIAENNNTTVRSIMRLNYLTNPNVIYEGQQLVIIPRQS